MRRLWTVLSLRKLAASNGPVAPNRSTMIWCLSRLRRIGSSVALPLIVGIVAIASVSMAQTNTVTLTGTVADQSGAAIPNASVTATNSETGIVHEQNTGTSGQFTIADLPPGYYDVTVAAPGFSKVVRSHQQLLVGNTSAINFTLSVSSVSQTVTVTTEVPTVSTTQSVLQTVVQTQQLNTLPIINRSFTALAQLSPGVQVNAAGTSVQFGDSGTLSNGYIVDGVSIAQDNFGAGANGSTGELAKFAQDWIQEFSVATELAPAEYNLSSAGFINAVTRSGGNTIHGRAYGYFQNAALNATPAFLPPSAPTKPSYDQQRIGGFLGGPIEKNKLFYFIGFEWLNNLTSTPVNVPAAFTGSPTNAPGVYPQTTVNYLSMVKLDYQASPTQSFHFRANNDYDILGNNGIGASGSSVNTLGVGTSSRTNGVIYQVTWDNVLSPTLLNEVVADYSKSYSDSQCNAASILGPYAGGGTDATTWGNPTGYYAYTIYPGAGVTQGCTVFWGGAGEANWTFQDNLTITRGSHDIKLGVDAGYRNLYNKSIHRLTDGIYVMPGSLLTPFDPASGPSGFPFSYTVNYTPNNTLLRSVPDPFWGMYIQDNWKATSNLTLNLGLRYDLDLSNSYIKILPILNPIHNDTTNFAPRLGFAWTPFADKNTVLRGGFGIYFDQQHGDIGATYLDDNTDPLLDLSLNALSPALNPYCIADTSCASGVPLAYQQAVEEVLGYAYANYELPNFNPPGGQITLGGNTYTIPTLSVPPPTSLFNYEQDFKVPATMQSTVGVARQFGDGLSVTGDFVYEHGYNLYNYYNANISPVTLSTLYPQYTTISTYGSEDYFNQYSVRAQASYRDHRGDFAHAVYTFTKGWDNNPGSAFLIFTSTYATDPFNLNLDYGPISVPVNILTVSGGTRLPYGFMLSPIINYASGPAYTATTTSRNVPGCLPYYAQCYPAGYSKDSLRGGSTFSLNARLSKTFQFTERYSGTLMFEGYNITNRLNPTAYQHSVQAPNFQQPIGAGPTRQLQAGFELDF